MMGVMRWHGRFLRWTKNSRQFRSAYRRWWECWPTLQGSMLYTFGNAHKIRHVGWLRILHLLTFCCGLIIWLTNRVYRLLLVQLARLRCGFHRRQKRLLKNLWYPRIRLAWKGLTRIGIWICMEMKVNWLALELLVDRVHSELHHLCHIAMIR